MNPAKPTKIERIHCCTELCPPRHCRPKLSEDKEVLDWEEKIRIKYICKCNENCGFLMKELFSELIRDIKQLLSDQQKKVIEKLKFIQSLSSDLTGRAIYDFITEQEQGLL